MTCFTSIYYVSQATKRKPWYWFMTRWEMTRSELVKCNTHACDVKLHRAYTKNTKHLPEFLHLLYTVLIISRFRICSDPLFLCQYIMTDVRWKPSTNDDDLCHFFPEIAYLFFFFLHKTSEIICHTHTHTHCYFRGSVKTKDGSNAGLRELLSWWWKST